ASIPPAQLDSLVAPVALYPDPLLSQLLVASTYPLEIVEAYRWQQQNSNLKGKDLVNAAAKQSWDASVQALVVFPDVLKQLNDNISWTTDLGNAFLAQQADVMAAVQRLRSKASQDGKLQSTPQQTVTTVSEGGNTYVEIQPATTQVIYVPEYDPYAVWGAPVYPYPSIVYPWGAVAAATAISFGVGMAVGALWANGGWGWHTNWARNNVVINNNFIRNNHFNNVNVRNSNVWEHNAAHRQGVPYSNSNVSNRFNQNNVNRQNRPTANQVQKNLGEASRQIGQSGLDRSKMPNGQGTANRMQNLNPGAGAADRMGNRQVGGGNQMGNRGAFNGVSQGGGGARMNSNRGASSFGGFHGGGGGFRGGGGGFRGG